MQKKGPSKNELIEAVNAFMEAPFPERSTNDEADQLHADLLLYDSAMGDLIMGIVQGERVPVEELVPDTDLRDRLTALLAQGDPVAAPDAQQYLDYLDRLDRLVAMARAVVKKR